MDFLNLLYMDFSYKRSMSLKIWSELKEKKQCSIYHFIAYEMLILNIYILLIGSGIFTGRYFRFHLIETK
jgi:hypothetical protein